VSKSRVRRGDRRGWRVTQGDIIKTEGVGALFKGALPRMIWIAPLGAMNFAGYELAKRALKGKDEPEQVEKEVQSLLDS
jgi:Mitochondrial carrier protein